MAKSRDAFRTISEVAEWLDTPAHVLRFWESKFTQVKPVKRAGGRRYYRPADMTLLGGIKKLLHEDGMTIKGVQKILREQGVKHVSSLSIDIDSDPAMQDDKAPETPADTEADAPFIEVEQSAEESSVVAFAPAAPDAEAPGDANATEDAPAVSDDSDDTEPMAQDDIETTDAVAEIAASSGDGQSGVEQTDLDDPIEEAEDAPAEELTPAEEIEPSEAEIALSTTEDAGEDSAATAAPLVDEMSPEAEKMAEAEDTGADIDSGGDSVGEIAATAEIGETAPEDTVEEVAEDASDAASGGSALPAFLTRSMADRQQSEDDQDVAAEEPTDDTPELADETVVASGAAALAAKAGDAETVDVNGSTDTTQGVLGLLASKREFSAAEIEALRAQRSALRALVDRLN
ncbi:MerR family transcriptional regulator [Thalassococcus lentus]|uniref:MerR family transcriptional regulator n=1 Tax=Thalassococcus lentus TaxID=1210524 RepID=A0ABT4XQD7_9RHOB|nr:MerR family transcriptional regulator [Thalassococcus lentus]MDA7424158.1 MerR family transcriptional regulator [Thalassococcus lentus]